MSLSPMPDPEVSERFYEGALPRMVRCMAFIGVAATVVMFAFFGGAVAFGFAAGAAMSYLNFRWLSQSVTGLLDRVSGGASRERGGWIIGRFLLRYGLVAVVCYGIFLFSRVSLYGVAAGLSLPVAAGFCEAAYETYAAFRRGI